MNDAENGREFDGATTDLRGPATEFDFAGRNGQPPHDAVHALLSLAYSTLAKNLTIACYAVGFDPTWTIFIRFVMAVRRWHSI